MMMMKLLGILLAVGFVSQAQPRRVVIVKLDGVPEALIEQGLQETDARTGKSRLPWSEEIFVRHGTRIENFYVRGISLSAPSWSMLDSGEHQRIHGNVEYDRYTLRPYDYLNFFPFYVNNASRRRADMPGVEVLDASGVPLLIDRFSWDQRYQSFQLYQRWVRWKTLQRSLEHRFTGPPRDLLDKSQIGFDLSAGIDDQSEKELIAHLADANCLYLDLYSGSYDHIAHLTNDPAVQLAELSQNDAMIGRIWTAVQRSPLAASTLFVVVSDHGMNTTPGTYSQGYSLVDWFTSTAGGAHHTITDRYPLTEYRVRGLNPMVSSVTTASPESAYLKDESQAYPTACLDVDGNERAALQLRNGDLNELHLLLKQINRKQVGAAARFFALLDTKRDAWSRSVDSLEEEIAAVRKLVAQQKDVPKGTDQDSLRRSAQLLTYEQDDQTYSEYIRIMRNLLGLKHDAFKGQEIPIANLIPKRSLGEPNTIENLRHYVVAEGRQIDYFRALMAITVRNSVQAGVSTHPIDFLAARTSDGILLYAGEDRQAVVLSRVNAAGATEIRYVPQGPWKAGLPLELWEDVALSLPGGADREAWLSEWHTDSEWLRAVHRTQYSNGIIGIVEQFERPEPLSAPSEVLKRFQARKRRLAEADLLIFANNHWNFNVRGFNPGGNHGSFFGISTRSVLMFAGGPQIRIPARLQVSQPYDSLSFLPTVLKLLGRDAAGLPGPAIEELFVPAQGR